MDFTLLQVPILALYCSAHRTVSVNLTPKISSYHLTVQNPAEGRCPKGPYSLHQDLVAQDVIMGRRR